jgi:hypothetical protein
MGSSAAVWLVLLIALIAANLPFVNERLFVIGPSRAPKLIGWRLLELVVLWGLTLAIGFGLEARAGQIQPQGWEFYAALGFTFLTFAFPGFVWRYLRRGR